MKAYSVKEISKITGANEETVRRWFRSGKLPNNLPIQGKDKYASELDLIGFLRNSPKYMRSAIDNLSNYASENKDSFLIGAAIGLIGGGLIAFLSDEKEIKSEVEKAVTTSALNKEILLSENEINAKVSQIERLQKEIEKEEEYLRVLKIKKEEIVNAK